MPYLFFDQSDLKDIRRSGGREFIVVDSSGNYCSSTLAFCNTRKYHGLLVSPQPQIDRKHHVLLSNLDETIYCQKNIYELAVHQYPGTLYPTGFQYLKSFSYERIPEWIYESEEFRLRKSIVFSKSSGHLMMGYELLGAHKPVKLRIKPFFAMRNMDTLQRANFSFNRKFLPVQNGISLNPDKNYNSIFLQFSGKSTFVPVPDWYYNVEFPREQERGYDYREDLYVPGYFEITLRSGQFLILSAGQSEIKPGNLKRQFRNTVKKQPFLHQFDDCLRAAAAQFIVKNGSQSKVMAGWHWFGSWGRDTFISLPGLTIYAGNIEMMEEILDTAVKDLKDGLFPNAGSGLENDYNSIDAPLWFIWAVQKYAAYTGDYVKLWNRYGAAIEHILSSYRNGTRYGIKMNSEGLINSGEKGIALTWMDAVVDGQPVTPRTGMPVEINALWYNAICFAIEAALEADDNNFADEWEELPSLIRQSFVETFWDEKKGYLADCVFENNADWSLRPNQVIATSLPYSPVDEGIRKSVLEVVKHKLITPRGMRTLSSDDQRYRGQYKGNQANRDRAYHQGTVWPWLLGHFAEGYLKAYGTEGTALIRSLYECCQETIFEHGIGTISEIYDGDLLHSPRGAISQAWSVAEFLRISRLLNRYELEMNQEEQQDENIEFPATFTIT